MRHALTVVEPEPLFTAELERLGIATTLVTPEDAVSVPGFALDLDCILLAFPPGAYPLVENEAFQSTLLLYAYADSTIATVGPILIRGDGPCPRCMEGLPGTKKMPKPSPASLAWSAASVALELETLRVRELSTLLGMVITWSIGTIPGIVCTDVALNPDCPARLINH